MSAPVFDVRIEGVPAPRRPGTGATLRDLLAVVCRYWRGAALIVAASLVTGLGWLYLVRDDAYVVQAKVLVRPGREQGPPPSVAESRTLIPSDRATDAVAEAALISNADLVAQLVDTLGLAQPRGPVPPPAGLVGRVRWELRRAVEGVRTTIGDLLQRVGLRQPIEPRRAAIETLQRSILVEPVKQGPVVQVRMVLPQATGADVVLNTLLDLYVRRRLELYADRSTVDFFLARVDDSDQRLRVATDSLRRFEAEAGIVEIEEQERVLLGQLARVQEQLGTARVALREAESREARVLAAVAGDSVHFAAIGGFRDDPFPQRLLSELASLVREREQLRVSEREGGPRLAANARQTSLLLGMLRDNVRTAREERTADVASREAQRAALQERLDALNGRQAQWQSLQRRRTLLEEGYLLNRRKLEEAQAAAGLSAQRIGNVSIIEHAVPPLRPAGPRKLVLLAAVLFGGLVAAAAWIAIAAFLDPYVHDADSLERVLELPVIAAPAWRPIRGGRNG